MLAGKILIIDDEERMCAVIKAALATEDIEVSTAYDGASAMKQFNKDHHDVVVTDLKMPGMDGLTVLKEVKSRSPQTEVILMTAYATAQTAVEAMKQGAYDYIIKPFEIAELRLKTHRILEQNKLREENRELRYELKQRYSLDNMIGHSGSMQKVYQLVQKVAPSDATVLIRGESGTGKELIAQAVHNISSRASKPFIAVNCAALPETLLESELFGYERGAFTGAEKRKLGRFELARDGSVFLDEIGDITPATQIKLLRVLQNKEFNRLGATDTIITNARIIAATNRKLEDALKENTFRKDLYYRINVFPIFLPPLRDRKEDIPDLVTHFLQKLQAPSDAIDTKAMQLLMDYPWPGNVRELQNVIERAFIMASGNVISAADLPPHIRGEADMPISLDEEEQSFTIEEMEKHMIRRALAKAEGNKSLAAKMLGITRRRLYSMMARLK
jgi:DNA-binding NtrC family response regulator